jgi:hypothetical protein
MRPVASDLKNRASALPAFGPFLSRITMEMNTRNSQPHAGESRVTITEPQIVSRILLIAYGTV